MGSKLEKAKNRLKSEPSDYTFDEAEKLLNNLGYQEYNKGKTSGSRVIFIKGKIKILMHKPHPGNEMRQYAVRQLKDQLKSVGDL